LIKGLRGEFRALIAADRGWSAAPLHDAGEDADYARGAKTGVFFGGMLPKMESALDALTRGARSAIICGSAPGALARALAGEGTTVVRG